MALVVAESTSLRNSRLFKKEFLPHILCKSRRSHHTSLLAVTQAVVDAVLVGTELDRMRHRATHPVRGLEDVLSLSAALAVLRVAEERCDPRRRLRCGDHLYGVRGDVLHVHSQPVFSVPTALVKPVDSFLERGEDHRAWFVDGWEFRSAREVHLQDILSTLVEPDDVAAVSRHDGTLSLFGGKQNHVCQMIHQ